MNVSYNVPDQKQSNRALKTYFSDIGKTQRCTFSYWMQHDACLLLVPKRANSETTKNYISNISTLMIYTPSRKTQRKSGKIKNQIILFSAVFISIFSANLLINIFEPITGKWFSIIFNMAGILASIIYGCYLTFKLVFPLERVHQEIAKMGHGDFSAEIGTEGLCEIHKILKSLRIVQIYVKLAFQEFAKYSSTSNKLAIEAVSINTLLTSNTEYLNQAVLEISESFSNLQTRLQNCAEALVTLSNLAHSISGMSNTANQTISKIYEPIASIESLSKTILSVTGSNEKIVLQTKVLSINASIEATRSDKSRKATSALASEVDELASQSTSLLDQIVLCVEGIRSALTKIETSLGCARRVTQEAKTGTHKLATFIEEINMVTAALHSNTRHIAIEFDQLKELEKRNLNLISRSEKHVSKMMLHARLHHEVVDSFTFR